MNHAYNHSLSPKENYKYWANLGPKELLDIPKNYNESLFHEAARERCANFLKKSLFINKLLSQKNRYGESVYLLLAQFGQADLIPKELLTKNVLLEESSNRETPLKRILEKNQIDLIPQRLIDKGILLENLKKLKTTYLHFCMMCGELQKVPPKLWDDKLGLKDSEGNNLLHWAADGGKLKDLKLAVDSLSLLCDQNKLGQTPLHKYPYLCDLPSNYLNPHNLSIQDKQGNTPIHTSIQRGGLSYLPVKVIREELLITKNNQGQTPIDLMIISSKKIREFESFRTLIKCLSYKVLKELISEYPPIEVSQIIKLEASRKKMREQVCIDTEIKI
jgi:ankyrin repeat protein